MTDPASTAPNKPPLWKRKWFIGVVLLALIGIAGSLSETEETETTPTAQDTATLEPTEIPSASPATPQERETPTETDPPEETTTPKEPPPRFRTFGDGQHIVGTDIRPGTYRTRVSSEGCYWARLKNFRGGLNSIKANDNTDDPAVVTILKADRGFESSDCGEWTDDLSAITASGTSFTDGIYILGTDMKAGTYRSGGKEGCYWARLRDFTGGLNSIIANDNTDSRAIVELRASDAGFQSNDCGRWRRI